MNKFCTLGLIGILILSTSSVYAKRKKKKRVKKVVKVEKVIKSEPILKKTKPVVKKKKIVASSSKTSRSMAIGITTGFYALDGVSSNWHSELTYDYFLNSDRFFIEAVAGVGPAVTKSKTPTQSQIGTERNLLITYGLQSVIRVGRNKYINYKNPYHFLTMGVTGAYIGGETAIGITGGFGTRYPIKVNDHSLFSLRYEVKDQIYTRTIALENKVTHNIYLGVGFEMDFISW